MFPTCYSGSMRNLFIIILLLLLINACATRRETMNTNKNELLINITQAHPRIRVDMRYATDNNFTGQTVYSADVCLARPVVVDKLSRIQTKLEMQGLGLKVYDCFRPKSAQQKFWDLVQDERYVFNPAKGSRHTRGTAVDLTLVDKFGNELEMPSVFDDFSEKSHRSFMACSPTAIQNRALLERMMVDEGFEPLPTEWWHFDLVGWRSFAELDLEF